MLNPEEIQARLRVRPFRRVAHISLLLILLNPLPPARAAEPTDPRDIRTGLRLPGQAYCDQPYVVLTRDGDWLCVLTTGAGREGQRGQHVVSTVSQDRGRTWSPLVDIEPADGPEASWGVPLVTPSGRVYAFYDYNGDRVASLRGKPARADMLGWYVYKVSDDGGRSWSRERHRLPMRLTACDRGNDWGGDVQIFWGICKPQVVGRSVVFSFTKLGKYMLEQGEGWLYRSDNVLTEPDPARVRWELLPEGDHGIRAPEFGSVQEEHNLVSLGGDRLYCVYRTTAGHPCQSTSEDGGRTWSKPEPMTYAPGGRRLKNPRACPKVWRTKDGRYLFWFHNHGGKTFEDRNPAWVCGGVERGGTIHWSQPEILLYDPDPKTRMSYPDLIEQDGRYWVTETQKTVARVHEIDPTLLAGLWRQGEDRTVSERGRLLDLDAGPLREREVRLPRPLDLLTDRGLTLDFWLTLSDAGADQAVLDGRSPDGKGLAVTTAADGALRVELNDGRTRAAWDSDPGLLPPGRPHHVAIVVDAGPRVISFVIDGVLNDGGSVRQFGWGRWQGELGDVSSRGSLRAGPAGTLHRLRVYDRALRTSEAVAHFHAGR